MDKKKRNSSDGYEDKRHLLEDKLKELESGELSPEETVKVVEEATSMARGAADELESD